MKKTGLFFLTFLFFCLSLYSQGFLRVNGKHIENDKNKDFILRGMGFGGWMLQEGYMFDLGFLGQQYKIKEKITELIGKKEADIFHYNRCYVVKLQCLFIVPAMLLKLRNIVESKFAF